VLYFIQIKNGRDVPSWNNQGVSGVDRIGIKNADE
jgi:hypothetical protein